VDEPWWVTLHVRCVVFEVGRLQYAPFRLGRGPENPPTWYTPAEADRRGQGFRAGDAALSVHIPGGSPLTPESCRASLRDARTFFDELLPVHGRRLAICSSWLLDDQLETMLPAQSNIVAFQRSFNLVPGWVDGDHGVRTFAFRDVSSPPDQLPVHTSLQWAVADHLRRGEHFHWRTGWQDLPEAP
jgi:hypothetical protein